MKIRAKAKRSSNSLGQWEEGEELRATFDLLWDLQFSGPRQPLDHGIYGAGTVSDDALFDYFLALDEALSGVSKNRLSRLLRGAVAPPRLFLPFIARAYEMEPKRGRRFVISNNLRYCLYRKMAALKADTGQSLEAIRAVVEQECLKDGLKISEETLRDIWIDFGGERIDSPIPAEG
jgi:transcriptional regulator with XRE-family HTH domain